ncbi:uncharacterized protein CLUP02_03547 [Colletotrichum lupini]|uniref:Uncharacterized protein n=1 Tax=Colletotrichum lupini TaxID=145971 RepID=A0A9Q8SJ14_9PEZI|nr:uncharacterized protein CLUP02_03547 [Colletotrichum lupini]UQC78073.1 hypothetical protein CLUP02_03547 [Colletotrichum lupini]
MCDRQSRLSRVSALNRGQDKLPPATSPETGEQATAAVTAAAVAAPCNNLDMGPAHGLHRKLTAAGGSNGPVGIVTVSGRVSRLPVFPRRLLISPSASTFRTDCYVCPPGFRKAGAGTAAGAE